VEEWFEAWVVVGDSGVVVEWWEEAAAAGAEATEVRGVPTPVVEEAESVREWVRQKRRRGEIGDVGEVTGARGLTRTVRAPVQASRRAL
jgi:hypothetical protein